MACSGKREEGDLLHYAIMDKDLMVYAPISECNRHFLEKPIKGPWSYTPLEPFDILVSSGRARFQDRPESGKGHSADFLHSINSFFWFKSNPVIHLRELVVSSRK
jgi:hypothetical protein